MLRDLSRGGYRLWNTTYSFMKSFQTLKLQTDSTAEASKYGHDHGLAVPR